MTNSLPSLKERIETANVRFGWDLGKPGGDKSILAEVEVKADGTLKLLSFGPLIEGEVVKPTALTQDHGDENE